MNDLSKEEMQLVCIVRSLKPYEKIEIKLKDNMTGMIQVTITQHNQFTYSS